MATRYDLSQLSWMLSGYTPNAWLSLLGAESLCGNGFSETMPVPARVPGSVQKALVDAGIIPDWNIGMNCHLCEWVENRHWVYEATIPTEWLRDGCEARLDCLGLDYSGWIYVNDRLVSEFHGGHQMLSFGLSPVLSSGVNKLRIILDMPPRYLGYTGFTSRFTDWKARFSYSWDWMVRLVTVGISGDLVLTMSDAYEIEGLEITTRVDSAGFGTVRATARITAVEGAVVSISIRSADGTVTARTLPADRFASNGVDLTGLPVDLWWPNGHGDQPLYTLECVLLDRAGVEQDRVVRRVGFRDLHWQQCEGAPEGADPWLCVVNGKPVFIQGVNWTPIRPNFHDLTVDDYRSRIAIYKDMGVNLFRVWGGGILENEVFYDLCDELGIMVWQEFPLSSSTFENWPPEGDQAVQEMLEIAASFIPKRQHHPSLIMWCGGNELHKAVDDGNGKTQASADLQHPMMAALSELISHLDPTRRFVPTSPTGPRLSFRVEDSGMGLHWDIHGPWCPESGMDEWEAYWSADDALFRSEVGAPGASPTSILKEYCAANSFEPRTSSAPVFRRQFDGWWWAEWPQFEREVGRVPESPEEFSEWSAARQARALKIATRSCKRRFPRCGGVILWMGHDCFPCSSNTSVIDFHGDPKPAVSAIREVFLSENGT